MNYGYKRIINGSFEEIEAVVREKLQEQGFGVITEIDVKATMRAKLDVDFTNYKILGACNPPAAHAALVKDPGIGLLLPCNVVLWENDDHSITVAAIDAAKLLAITGNDELTEFAQQINGSLISALDSL
ncbi:MAG: DUF302 domain-containing protein [Candidatus Marinimicrobia bacterium]|nr:DUF302 domain-containing protein [Candidatus Neomarinimicrobiota bacterium]